MYEFDEIKRQENEEYLEFLEQWTERKINDGDDEIFIATYNQLKAYK